VNGRLLLVGDGLKVSKEGRKMPGVKALHQQSESNSKANFIMGHSFQAVGILAGALNSAFAVPLISRIHEGVVFSNRDKRTLLDKMIILLESLKISEPFYFIADAYYASGHLIHKLLKQDAHLITRVKSMPLQTDRFRLLRGHGSEDDQENTGTKSSSKACSTIRNQ
jgi:hypothetical protein